MRFDLGQDRPRQRFGAADVASVVTRSAVDANVPNGDSGVAVANCLGNEVMLSGGAFWNAATTGNKGLQASFPLGSQAWVGIGKNQSGNAPRRSTCRSSV